MKVNTTRFGEIDIEEDKIIKFTHGVLGFADVKRYIVLDYPDKTDAPLKLLHAVDDPDLTFVITDPFLFCPDYMPEISEKDLKELDITAQSDCGIISIITIPHGEPEKMTANLQGPILINLKTLEAKQVVLSGDDYPIRYPLLKNIPAFNSIESP